MLRDRLGRFNGTPYDPVQRFWQLVKKTNGCWLWEGHIGKNGYGYFAVGHQVPVLAHRYSYELAHGKIPDELEIDHLCRTRHCVNPQHLETVTHAENLGRGNMFDIGSLNRYKTHCPKGHEYNETNAYYYKYGRQCRLCKRQEQIERRRKL